MTEPDIVIYTDGSCLGNPGPGGWGVVFIQPGREPREICGRHPQTTNNRMELTAAIEALKRLSSPMKVRIFTDSIYLRDGIDKWIDGWKRGNWRNSAKKPVKNKDLWQELDQSRSRHQVDWRWVRAHADDPCNNRADAIARAAAERQNQELQAMKRKADAESQPASRRKRS